MVNALYDHLTNAGNEVKIRDLYKMKFNPVLSDEDFLSPASKTASYDIETEQKHVKWADHLIFVYPVWWGGMPAAMKGYIDRVFSEGFAYEYVDGESKGLLSPRKGSTICTTGACSDEYRNVHDAINLISREVIFDFVGIETCKQLFYGGVPSVSDDVRQSYIRNVIEEFS
jgi:NAD(P)H dehydrogenase (quinone)